MKRAIQVIEDYYVFPIMIITFIVVILLLVC